VEPEAAVAAVGVGGQGQDLVHVRPVGEGDGPVVAPVVHLDDAPARIRAVPEAVAVGGVRHDDTAAQGVVGVEGHDGVGRPVADLGETIHDVVNVPVPLAVVNLVEVGVVLLGGGNRRAGQQLVVGAVGAGLGGPVVVDLLPVAHERERPVLGESRDGDGVADVERSFLVALEAVQGVVAVGLAPVGVGGVPAEEGVAGVAVAVGESLDPGVRERGHAIHPLTNNR
jgi:hypothetical protein